MNEHPFYSMQGLRTSLGNAVHGAVNWAVRGAVEDAICTFRQDEACMDRMPVDIRYTPEHLWQEQQYQEYQQYRQYMQQQQQQQKRYRQILAAQAAADEAAARHTARHGAPAPGRVPKKTCSHRYCKCTIRLGCKAHSLRVHQPRPHWCDGKSWDGKVWGVVRKPGDRDMRNWDLAFDPSVSKAEVDAYQHRWSHKGEQEYGEDDEDDEDEFPWQYPGPYDGGPPPGDCWWGYGGDPCGGTVQPQPPYGGYGGPDASRYRVFAEGKQYRVPEWAPRWYTPESASQSSSSASTAASATKQEAAAEPKSEPEPEPEPAPEPEPSIVLSSATLPARSLRTTVEDTPEPNPYTVRSYLDRQARRQRAVYADDDPVYIASERISAEDLYNATPLGSPKKDRSKKARSGRSSGSKKASDKGSRKSRDRTKLQASSPRHKATSRSSRSKV